MPPWCYFSHDTVECRCELSRASQNDSDWLSVFEQRATADSRNQTKRLGGAKFCVRVQLEAVK